MARLTYILKRILQMIPVLFVVIVLIFVMIRLIPGDPARLMLGETAVEADVEALREAMGLNEPYTTQFAIFFKNLLHFDFGNSLLYKTSCIDLVKERLPLTVSLTVVATLFSLLISIPLGFVAGLHKDKASDQAIRISALAAISMPTFWVGLLLMIAFSVKIRIFPAGGWGTTPLEHLQGLILPGIAQALMTAALLMRNLRNSVVDISRMDYVDFAVSKGVSTRRVRSAYIMKNSLISTITLLSTRITYMLGGSVVIETVFSLPGCGKLLVDAIFARDYAMVQCMVFIFALIVLLVSLITDIIYSFIDPRITL
ncbi:ABC transporter permease [Lawsonibacter celer]|uniref:ABC transporter permease n=1 Tax=Lawsonibacter celer TaxID=2986526 RepID=UPI00164636DD|nr:ABC transporter permease [Lawsonibacter celer]